MKLAIAGKGGSGKTSISGTMARLLARDGHDVLAIDGDSNPNLAVTLGMPPERMDRLATLEPTMVRRTTSGTAELTSPLEEIFDTHSVIGPDGVRLLVMAHPQHAGTGCLCSVHATVRSVIEVSAQGDGDVCILDTEASPEHLSRGTTRHVDAMLCVVEPYYKSLETGRRMAALGADLGLPRVALVANKIRDEREHEAVMTFAERHGLDVAGVVPFDDSMPAAERAESAPLDFAPDSPAVRAIGDLARSVVAHG
ncbi:MAG TPA: ArsA-related P-loop ATPase [Solirubrobacteraceae bacterium]|nr:ArsA-related P-loop ATPase [Solirubrobacteraceae bacterium]